MSDGDRRPGVAYDPGSVRQRALRRLRLRVVLLLALLALPAAAGPFAAHLRAGQLALAVVAEVFLAVAVLTGFLAVRRGASWLVATAVLAAAAYGVQAVIIAAR
ncbi:hypothetical protein AB0M46_40905 [Dactylosporangium sp. NPDC051485]|uniref:hypothetical protein n=1 Tax=Dactylosporangium sp. NPDC051485 TaxID=3154846 RepID=UPI003412E550